MVKLTSAFQVFSGVWHTSAPETLSESLKPLSALFSKRLLPLKHVNEKVLYMPCCHSCAHFDCSHARLHPLKTNQAENAAFAITKFASSISINDEVMLFISDACSVLEMDLSNLFASSGAKGTGTRAIVHKLRAASLHLLTSALSWPSFRAKLDPSMTGQTSVKDDIGNDWNNLKGRIVKVC